MPSRLQSLQHVNAEKFVIWKLEYWYANPISCKWNLAQGLVAYFHSSVVFYELNANHPCGNYSLERINGILVMEVKDRSETLMMLDFANASDFARTLLTD